MELFDVSEKVIVVTGASGALAGAAVRYLSQQGARVALLSRNREKLDAVVVALVNKS